MKSLICFVVDFEQWGLASGVHFAVSLVIAVMRTW
jgi:hypothetical protein